MACGRKSYLFVGGRFGCLLTALASLHLANPALADGQFPAAHRECRIVLSSSSLRDAIILVGEQCNVSLVVRGNTASARPITITGRYRIDRILRSLFAGRNYKIISSSERVIVVELLSDRPAPQVRRPPGNIPSRPQPAPAPEPPPVTITVTGVRLQNALAIEAKEQRSAISEIASQDDIGRYPDFNLADAARRLPGTFALRDEEEGISIGLRGLSPQFNLVTIDGMQIATDPVLQTRQEFVEILPAAAFSEITAIKTREAAGAGNAIAGQTNFATRSALDDASPLVTLSASVGHFGADAYDAMPNRPALRAEAVISQIIGSDDTLGIVVAGSYFRRDQDEERVLTYYNDDFTAPALSIWNGIESPLERFGGYAKLEWLASDRLRLDTSGYVFAQNESFVRASNVINLESAAAPGVAPLGSDLVAAQNLTTSTPKRQYGVLLNGEYAADDLTVRLRGALSSGKVEDGGPQFANAFFTFAGPVGEEAIAFEFAEPRQPPIYTLTPSAPFSSPDNYVLQGAELRFTRNTSHATDVDIQLKHDPGESSLSFLGGLRFVRLNHSFLNSRDLITYLGATPLLLSQFGRLSPSYRAPYAPINSPIIDNAAVLAFIGANPSLFSGNLDTTQNRTPDFDISESVLAGYAALGYAGDRVRINAGLRVEQTDVEASAFETVNGVRQPITQTSDYTNWLPSVGITYDITDQLKLRAAYSRALGRANLPDLNPSRTVIEVSGVTTIAGGNTQLDPRVSDNFDVSLEYYFDGGRSLASVALFHKSIADEIFRLAVDTTVNGAPVVTTQPLNAQSASVTGFEINLVKDRLDFLPGLLADFGVSANYTYIWADARVPTTSGAIRELDFLIEQPDSLINASLFYQSGPVEARVSYNRTGRFARSIDPANPDNDNFIAAFETIDAQARWRIADNFTVIVEGRNLTDETNIELTGPGASKTEDFSRFGRAYFLGLTYNY